MIKKDRFVGFFLSEEELEKLWKLSEAHGSKQNSETMRFILNEAFDYLFGEGG